MGERIEDGGPAFPVAEDHKVADSLPWTAGMSLRDWFAGQALTGMIANSGTVGVVSSDALRAVAATTAYRMADAMLKARAPSPSQESRNIDAEVRHDL